MKVTEPKLFFDDIRRGKKPENYQSVIWDNRHLIWKFGFGYQTDSFSVIRGRIYMPHAGFPNCAPRNAQEETLGVAQDPRAWLRMVDIVDDPPKNWIWKDWGGPDYQALEVPEDGNIDDGDGEFEEDNGSPDDDLLIALNAIRLEGVKTNLQLEKMNTDINKGLKQLEEAVKNLKISFW